MTGCHPAGRFAKRKEDQSMTDINERPPTTLSLPEFRPASELLPLLAAAFPQTFFTDTKQVRPLKINIHHDLYARFQAHALPAELNPGGIKRFLHWYTKRTA